tara:strand:+ start:3542 stop:4798 length:1257 start_codon:yes stop_codon:yes gene_type:complete
MIELLKNIFSYSLYKIAGMLLSIIYVVYLGKILSADQLGVYYLTITVLSSAMVISRLGFDNLIVKQVSIFYDNGQIKKIIKFLKFLNTKVLIFSILLTILIVLFSNDISYYLLDTNKHKNKIIMISCCIYFYNMAFIYSESFKATGNLKLSVVFPSILFPLFNIIGVSILFPFFGENGVFISVCVSVILIYFSGNFFLNKKIEQENQLENNDFLLGVKIPVNFYLISVSNFIFASVDTIMLGFLSTNSDVGVYAILLRVVLPFSTLLIIINSVFARDFSIWYNNNQIRKCRENYSKLIKVSLLFGVPYFLLICFFGRNILLFFGEEFQIGAIPLTIVSLGYLLLLITGPSSTVLMMTGNEAIYRKLVIYVGILNVIFSYFLVNSYGLLGACISTTIALIIKNIGSFILVRNKLKIIKL